MRIDPFIEAEEAQGRSVKRCCDLLEVSRAAYYERHQGVPSPKAISDERLTARIRDIHATSKGTYGSPRVHRELRNQGFDCGRRRVARLMRLARLEGRCKRRSKKTTVSGPRAEGDLDLIKRAFHVGGGRGSRYCGDITFIPTWEGPAYLAAVIDLSSRRVVGWNLAHHTRTSLVTDALEMAFTHRRPARGAIFHSDRGSQYTSDDFKALARRHHVALSLGRRGDCFDNAVAESFFATIKRELIDGNSWPSRSSLRRALFDYIEGWYNTRRLHSSLGYLSPAAFEALDPLDTRHGVA